MTIDLLLENDEMHEKIIYIISCISSFSEEKVKHSYDTSYIHHATRSSSERYYDYTRFNCKRKQNKQTKHFQHGQT